MIHLPFFRPIALALCAGALGMALNGPALAQAGHDHGQADGHQLVLNQGQKWATDAPLRQSMARIRELVAPQLDAAHAGKMSAARYQTLAGQTEQQIGVIVKECKLEPAADAVLHVVIARMGESLDIMSGKTGGDKEQALVQLARTVNDYGTHFEHPGFRPIALGH